MQPRVTFLIIWTSEVHPVFNWLQHALKQQQNECSRSLSSYERKHYTMKQPGTWSSRLLPFCSKWQDPKVQPRVTVFYYLKHLCPFVQNAHWSGGVLETIYSSICTCQVRICIQFCCIYIQKSVKLCALVRARVRVVCIRSAWGSRVGGVESTGRIWLTRPVFSGFVCASTAATAPLM